MNIDFTNNIYTEKVLRNYIKNNQLSNHDWVNISEYQKLSEKFIREFQDKVDWSYISEYQVLSENFIREFNGKVYWSYISDKQILSESFIKEFKYKLNWYFICEHQVLSVNFIDEMIQDGFIKEEYIKLLLENEKINQEELRSYLSI